MMRGQIQMFVNQKTFVSHHRPVDPTFESNKITIQNTMGFLHRKKVERGGTESQTGESPLPTTSTTATTLHRRPTPSQLQQYVELGTIDYVNLTKDGRHGDYDTVIAMAQATGKPIFANFVEWSG
jgi:hypothetical protein